MNDKKLSIVAMRVKCRFPTAASVVLNEKVPDSGHVVAALIHKHRPVSSRLISGFGQSLMNSF